MKCLAMARHNSIGHTEHRIGSGCFCRKRGIPSTPSYKLEVASSPKPAEILISGNESSAKTQTQIA